LKVKIPKQVFLEELYEQTEAPWWKVEGCLDSEAAGDKSQLVIFIKPLTRDIEKVRVSSVWTAILAENYAPGYDRYFLSLRSPIAYSGFAAFDGNIILDRRLNKVHDFDEYAGILENDLIFWVPFIKTPYILNKIYNYFLAFKLQLLIKKYANIFDQGVEIHIRNARIHLNGWRVVLQADVVFESREKINCSYVKINGSRILSKSIKEARKRRKWHSLIRYLPLGFARISLFSGDHRCRVLKNYGLRKELIGTMQKQSIKRIQSPDIYGSSIEYDGKIKYAWNKAWIEENDC